MSRPRKIPERICIGCQEKRPKRELLRVVRTPQGEIVIDLTGKKSGRGAYLCKDPACLQKALKGRGLEKNLRHPISPQVVEELTEYLTGGRVD
ncbi:MAG TPA: YlxR family protein [Bacillota bacterium]|jgi:predicted RNA-binding protein YlxR (DUF448 family)|nr:YlxR family protein [Bacillota bacterium]HOP68448.1 YlxR family protein [Bacillota bacterium]HPT33554.1 YlxR family protein [Bacillota bacterium]HPZ64876.1 YlxR family protein [Bacillota bacterium]